MIATLVKVRIDPANAAEFEKLFGDMAAFVHAHEPGTRTYHLAKSRTEDGCYQAIEVYESEEARKAHAETEPFHVFRPRFMALLLEPPTVERLDIVC